MHACSIAVFDHQLGALDAILTKAEAHCQARGIDPAVLLQARLFPDMYPLLRQVQLATDFAKGPAARLSAQAVPSFPDVEVTFPELHDRIARVRAFVRSVTPQMLEGAEARPVSFTLRRQPREEPGITYLTGFALPNFFFHVTTAYNILRHNGVELGKVDFIAR